VSQFSVPHPKRSRHQHPHTGDEEKPAAVRALSGVAAHPHSERGNDVYETPPEAVQALLKVQPVKGPLWEPACGPGSIVRTLRAAGYRVIATDLMDYGCDDSSGGIDFLKQERAPESAQTIITNPPFRYANKFVRHALALVPRVLMLFPLRYLEGIRRSDILDGGQLACVYIFRERLPMMHRHGWQGPKATSQLAFGWFVWNVHHQGPTELRRISWKDDQRPLQPLIAPAVTTITPTTTAAPPEGASRDDLDDIPEFLRRRTKAAAVS
jgi:hypothetical protein